MMPRQMQSISNICAATKLLNPLETCLVLKSRKSNAAIADRIKKYIPENLITEIRPRAMPRNKAFLKDGLVSQSEPQ